MEKGFTQMGIDEWELLYHKNSHTIVQEVVLPCQAIEERVLSLGSNIKQQDSIPSQPNFQATKDEHHDEVIEEEVVEDELAQFCNYEKRSEDEEEEAEEEEGIDDEQAMACKTIADITSDGISEGISFTEEEEEEEEEELGEMVEYTGPESKEMSGRNSFRLRTLLRSAGLAAATFSIFLLQKSMPKNQKIQCKLSRNEKPKQLSQHQQEAPGLSTATSHSSFSWDYDMWY